jgi:hypothetical protein
MIVMLAMIENVVVMVRMFGCVLCRMLHTDRDRATERQRADRRDERRAHVFYPILVHTIYIWIDVVSLLITRSSAAAGAAMLRWGAIHSGWMWMYVRASLV